MSVSGSAAAPRAAILAGATGLVGSFLLEHLLGSISYASVELLARRDLGRAHPKLTTSVIDFARLDERRIAAEDVFCCLGTTIRVAGSQDAFRRVDFDYPVTLARAAARGGAKRFLVVSALGANSASRVFYNRVKGEMEAAVRASGVQKVYVFRPSLLSGPRQEARFGEQVGLVAGALLGPLLGKYRPIHADLVAAAMLKAAAQDLPADTFESDQIRRLAK